MPRTGRPNYANYSRRRYARAAARAGGASFGGDVVAPWDAGKTTVATLTHDASLSAAKRNKEQERNNEEVTRSRQGRRDGVTKAVWSGVHCGARLTGWEVSKNEQSPTAGYPESHVRPAVCDYVHRCRHVSGHHYRSVQVNLTRTRKAERAKEARASERKRATTQPKFA